MNSIAQKSSNLKLIYGLSVLRALFLSVILLLAGEVFDTGTPSILPATGVFAGVLLGTWLAFSRFSIRGAISLFSLSVLGYYLLRQALLQVTTDQAQTIFDIYGSLLQLDFFLGAALIGIVLSWAYWLTKHTATLEVLAFGLGCIFLVSSHRNFRFDLPRVVNTLSWWSGFSPLSTLILMGAGCAATIFIYLAIVSVAPEPGAATRTRYVFGRRRYIPSFIVALLVSLAIVLTSLGILDHYQELVLSRTSNGVGQESAEGLSPLGFHSALGGTAQPAGLVRLEGDYNENPHLPMLYLRESALSKLNGNELVRANTRYDKDVPHLIPEQRYQGIENPLLTNRKQVIQSIYLLADHNMAFALDYPTSLVRIKNPNTSRFKAAYRAYSEAPTTKIENLLSKGVGNPEWSKETWRHYLEIHPDSRYKEMAEKITAEAFTPVERAASIAEYLSANATYTLAPNHDVPDGGDPTAAFMFGDMRGYCVHFAHATVYMLRALEVPARIGTGYLTDLSQAKDGHVLLRMSDRHAWAEVYVTGEGWIPFDTQPVNVESHADTNVDMNLLEELMGMLEPGEEILPDEVQYDPAVGEGRSLQLPPPSTFIWLLFGLLLLLFAGKLYIRFGWLLPATTRKRFARSHLALVGTLADIGYFREAGETRSEFATRIATELGGNPLLLPTNLSNSYYSKRFELNEGQVKKYRASDLKLLEKLPLKKRALAALNPWTTIWALKGMLK